MESKMIRALIIKETAGAYVPSEPTKVRFEPHVLQRSTSGVKPKNRRSYTTAEKEMTAAKGILIAEGSLPCVMRKTFEVVSLPAGTTVTAGQGSFITSDVARKRVYPRGAYQRAMHQLIGYMLSRMPDDVVRDCCSWGPLQVMGFNMDPSTRCVDLLAPNLPLSYWEAHLARFCSRNPKLRAAIESHDFYKIGLYYNGAENGEYGRKLEKIYKSL